MAKVMISLPDELLERIDEYVRRQGTTRSALVRTLAERELHDEGRRQEILDILARAKPQDGRGTEYVREDRRSH